MNADQKSASLGRVLIVDDEPQIVSVVSAYLEAHGLSVRSATDAIGALAIPDTLDFDVILLDLGLPDADGLGLMQELRRRWRSPVIIVSGRGESVERIVGLELGADDYVVKPFDLRELLARIRCVMRRMRKESDETRVEHNAYAFDGLRLDKVARQLSGRNGESIEITTGEFELLRMLLEHPQQVLSRDQLMNATHGRDAGPYDRAIDVQIGRLRRKIETDPAAPRLIKSVRGVGYVFAVAVRRG